MLRNFTRDLGQAADARRLRRHLRLRDPLIALGFLEVVAGSFLGLWLAFVGWFIVAAATAEGQLIGATRYWLGFVVRGGMVARARAVRTARLSVAMS
jgi:hypothetical protein